MSVQNGTATDTNSPSNASNPIAPSDIPKRTSSYQAHPIFRDSAGNPISPSSPPRRKSSKRPMSGSVDAATYNASQGKMPFGNSSASSYRPQSSHFPASSQAYATAGASSGVSHSRSKSRRSTGPAFQKTVINPLHMAAGAPSSHISLKSISDDLVQQPQKQPGWTVEKERILLGPFDYLYGHPGKDIRAQLIAAFNAWLQVPEASLSIITKVIGMLHTASLLVDDVEDSSLLRRGAPVANSIFGTAQTINSANYVYFLALRELSTLQNPITIQIYTDELLNLHRGQGMDLFWRDTLTCPTESDYLEMVGNKTGGLFRLAIKLMQAESPISQQEGGLDCVPLVDTIGLLFQILDDLLNLSSPTYTARKGLCEDLTEGKFSFPVIHAIRADPGNLVLLNVLAQKTTDDEVKRYAVGYMESVGSFEYTKGVIKELEGKALVLIAELEKQVGGEHGRSGAEGVRDILGKLKKL